MPKRSKQHMMERRQQILYAAIECFRIEGFEGASMKKIGEHAGLSIGALYTHFKNRQELILALIDAVTKERDRKSLNSIDEFRAFLDESALQVAGETQQNFLQLNLHILKSCFTDEKIREKVEETMESQRAFFHRTLAILKDTKQICDSYDIEVGADLLNWTFVGALFSGIIPGAVKIDSLRALLNRELGRMTGMM
ncbi:TetR/AcrR family transcriptional regulator [Paremcibacter congregatus]|uniref:HTH tetR-type domain-containing protein n=1 Tax=Paremcibacter congregatus TaxID=2043170 RepID=A0A2G4YS46_9PROT|nr:TetR/AcrR family transcriptional regulator [Paremcibacter congregatus]PHZ85152.1 hypothetical protein CRD36_06990 [Paremcibacter congregatus]QDE27912.1 TetR/AcrR family transcriptional regulator [Paremcibacter congregatus]